VRIADRASRLYAPAVHSLAALTFAGWMLAGAGFYHALVIAIAVLIITCPCALGLAVPVAQVVAAGALMKHGVLIKDGSALERLAEVDRVLIDKTGTLTLGRPVPDAGALDALTPDEAGMALALASHSRHPLSQGLAEAWPRAGGRAAGPGGGSRRARDHALWHEVPVSLGRPSSPTGGMAAALALGADPVRLIGYVDALRPDAVMALEALRGLGLEASILSGDNAQAVAQVARQTGLTAQASASPQDKHDAIARLAAGGGAC
jgi:Cu2+-exporting ATPase